MTQQRKLGAGTFRRGRDFQFNYNAFERRLWNYYDVSRFRPERYNPLYQSGVNVVFKDDNGGTRTGQVHRWTTYGYLELRLPHKSGAFYLAPVDPSAIIRKASPLEQLAGQTE